MPIERKFCPVWSWAEKVIGPLTPGRSLIFSSAARMPSRLPSEFFTASSVIRPTS
jgi:hypothetical protein